MSKLEKWTWKTETSRDIHPSRFIEKLQKIRKYRDEKETFKVYMPKVFQMFNRLFEHISREIEDLEIEVDYPDLAVPALSKKYRNFKVYPAILKINDKPRLCFVYIDINGRKEVVEATKTHIRDIIAVGEVLGNFRMVVENAILDKVLEKEEEEVTKVRRFMKGCKVSYDGFADLLETLRDVKNKFQSSSEEGGVVH